MKDESPAVEQPDLVKRLAALEDAAFLTGTGQPLGILNTPGIAAASQPTKTELSLLDVLDAIAAVEGGHRHD